MQEVDENIVAAVNDAVLLASGDGYIGVLKALAELMTQNPNKETKKAARLVYELARVLDDYLED